MEIPDLRVWTSQLKRTQQTAAFIKASMESFDALNELEAVSRFSISFNYTYLSLFFRTKTVLAGS